MKYNLEFNFEKSTKNTHRYQEKQTLTSPLLVGTIYIQKALFPLAPDKLYVTVEDEQ
jgi:hypothetical protein